MVAYVRSGSVIRFSRVISVSDLVGIVSSILGSIVRASPRPKAFIKSFQSFQIFKIFLNP